MKLNTTLLAAVVASLAGLTATAAQFDYTSGDLLVAFRKSGSSDVEINLGSITIFKDTSNYRNFDYSSILTSTFGNLNNVSFTVIGTTRSSSANNGNAAANTSWLTLKRSDTETQTTAPNRYTPSKTQSVQSQISGIAGDGSGTGAEQYAINNANNTAPYIVIPNNSNDSFTTKFPSIGGLQSLVGSTVENTTPGSFSSYIRSDLYEYLPGPAGQPTTYLGNFTFSSNGNLQFTPVPEPREYAAIFGGLMLCGAVFYRRTYGHNNA